MHYDLPTIRTVDVKDKRVFLRADLDVPLAQQTTINKQQLTILDDTRLKTGLPTIQYLLENKAKLILAGHLGRPKGRDSKFTLEPVGTWFAKHFNDIYHLSKTAINDFSGWNISDRLVLLENLRFYRGEEENDPLFSQKLANLADIYVNDAFAVCHRSHASIVGVAKILPHVAGFSLQKEIETLSLVLQKPKRPLVVVVGGKKIETKLPLIQKMLTIADHVLVGGKIAQEVRINNPRLLVGRHNSSGTDITEESIKNFIEIIKTAKTIVWNGPLGVIHNSDKDTERGTREIAQAIIHSNAYTVVGGGDITEFLREIGCIEKFDFVSTGGGAMLAFLSGEHLPGLEALH